VALTNAGHHATSLSLDDLGSDLKAIIDERRPDVIFVSATPPFASAEAGVRCRLLRRKDADVPILAALWTSREDRGRAEERLVAAGAQGVVTSLADALSGAGSIARASA
jgi:hypothetical protein